MNPGARREKLRERLRLDYRQVATAPSGKRFVVTASRRGLPGDAASAFVPLPVLLVGVVVRQALMVVRREPRWQVEMFPEGQPNLSRIVATASKGEAMRRVVLEASGSTRGTD